MFDRIISWSLHHRAVVLLLALGVVIGGVWSLATMKVDILPDINKPTVAVFAEAPGLAADEVERLILAPLETAITGAPGVDRVRGTASFGLAIVNVEFAWGSDVLRNRQIIQERMARARVPENVRPVLGPVTSIMGEVVWAGLTSSNPKIDGMQLRTLADWTVRPALLRIPGVADVIVMGGEVREWQIQLNAEQMRRYGLQIEDIEMQVGKALQNKSGGIIAQGGKEYPIRILLAPTDVTQLRELAITPMERGGGMTEGASARVIRLADIATVREGASPVRGSATIDGQPGAILRIIRQPEAETLRVTEAVDRTLDALAPSLPTGVQIRHDLFRQEWFIRSGLGNVLEALRDGTILVAIVLILFLMNLRTTVITLTALPLSILVTAIVFRFSGFSVNVMTLGGLAVAIGELVDDAIVDVENVYRRLREWRAGDRSVSPLRVVLQASSEVRHSIVYATMLVAIVFLPVFAIPGVEGRLLASLGAAYLVALVASLVVSLSVTPVMCSLLLTRQEIAAAHGETVVVRLVKRLVAPGVRWCIRHVRVLLAVIAIALVASGGLYWYSGKEGIPPFNEGSATVIVLMPEGTDVDTSNQYASRVEAAVQQIPGVRRVSHITGRAGNDAHESGANFSEMQVIFAPGTEHERERLLAAIQRTLDAFPGASFSLGQPITHRVEMLLSGVRAPIVVKVFGDHPADMQAAAAAVIAEMEKVRTIKNPVMQKDVVVPELQIAMDRNRLADAGLSAGTVADAMEMGLMGAEVGQVRLGPASVNVVARYDAQYRGNTFALRDLPLPFTGAPSVGTAADVRVAGGQNRYSHEFGKRVLTVSANYQGTDIVGDVETVRTALAQQQLPMGVTLSFEGTYKSQKENSQRLAVLFGVGLILIAGILYAAFRSASITAQIMLNIPTVFIGGMVGIWLTGGVINLAHLVGFISLAGIVSRNGIMLIGRSLSLARAEGVFTPELVVRATLDRVVPVLMTSLVTALALVPLLLAGGAPGKELLHPLAVVIFGGLLSSTLISLFLTPALFYRFGRAAALRTDVGSLGL
ncbi:efflux RND transporter permease subunit [Candidatus Uhrbacteria bacterium]|nr:efflux RND transporter permease subunit [Candidatus Uhrbacteria bacterium]